MKLDLPTITPILKKLETKKLIKKSRSKQDERIILIKLTKKGIDLEDEVAKIQHKVACQTHLNPEEFNLLKNSLNDLTDAMTINDADKEDLKLNQCK